MYTFGVIEALSHFWTPRKKGTPGKRKLRIATSTNFLSLLHGIKRGTAGNKISLLNLSTWDNGFYTHFPSAHNPARIPPAFLSLSLPDNSSCASGPFSAPAREGSVKEGGGSHQCLLLPRPLLDRILLFQLGLQNSRKPTGPHLRVQNRNAACFFFVLI